MSARIGALAALLLATTPPAEAAAPIPADPAAARAIQSTCVGKDGFSDPAPAARIYGNVWYVGTCTVSAILLTSPQGNVLIAGAAGPRRAVPKERGGGRRTRGGCGSGEGRDQARSRRELPVCDVRNTD